jgi:hypothetical protein
MVDQYAVLGLVQGADQAAVHAAYRRLARRLHPDVDRSPGAADRMRRINAAYYALRELAAAPGELVVSTAPATVRQPSPTAAPGVAMGGAPGAAPRVAPGDPPGTAPGAASATMRPSCTQDGRAGGGWSRPAWRRLAPAFVGPAPGVDAACAARPAGALPSATTLGVVAGLCALVGVFASWSFVVARPAPSAAPARPAAAASPASAGVRQGATSLAAQASANAAANARAARDNVLAAASGLPAPTARAEQATGRPGAGGAGSTGSTAAAGIAGAPLRPAAAPEPRGAAPPVSTAGPEPPPAEPDSPPAERAPPSRPASGAAPGAASALASHDLAWSGYASALRAAAAGSHGLASRGPTAPGAAAALAVATMGQVGTAGGPGGTATALLSAGAQVTLARARYLQQQLAWSQHATVMALAAGLPDPSGVSRAPNASSASRATSAANGVAQAFIWPAGGAAARADLRLLQAAEIVAAAQASRGALSPGEAAQVTGLLDEAEPLHREWVAEWARFIAALGD